MHFELSMHSHLKSSLILYLRHFPLYLTLLSPVLIPTIFLHIVGRYANFGELAPIFTAIFGVLLNVITLFVVLSLIIASWTITEQSDALPSAKSVFGAAYHRSLPFLALFIIISLATFSVPALLAITGLGIEYKTALYIFSITSIAWIVAITLLTLFSSYILVIEKQGPIASIKKSAGIFLHRPLHTSLRFFGIIVATIAGSLILTIATTLVIASVTQQTDLLFNPDLAEALVPWWKDLIVNIYAYLGLPFLIAATTRLFYESRAESEKHELETNNRVGNPRPA